MQKLKLRRCITALILSMWLSAATHQSLAAPTEFVAARPEAGFALPPIVLPYDETTKTGFNWEQLRQLPWNQKEAERIGAPFRAAEYLREAVQRMTGRELPVVSGTDLSRGFVLTTLALAPPDVRNDPAVQSALRNNSKDSYNASEAFFIRSEGKRVLLVANTPEGLSHAVVELLESVGYEVLGMGPNWIHTPHFRNKPLAFNLERVGRPGFYIRSLWATSGQSYGVGTLTEVAHPADESVFDSYRRWRVGTRMVGQSMPNFPGHALQGHHKAVIEKMRETGTTAGFLVPKTTVGLDAARPAATAEIKDHLWINSDAAGTPEAGKVFISDGAKWVNQNPIGIPANIDLSVSLVREIILESTKAYAQALFEKHPEELLIIGTDPEDGGGYADLGKLLSSPNWYPEYLKNEGIPFGRPYVLHGFKGLNQPREIWDANAPSDTVFGFNNWLLREFDKWIDSLPAGQRVTATGKHKKQQVRASLYSYNYHDVPPNFNLDPRIRVMIASFPKHRGWDKWKNLKTQTDMVEAYQVMLPREPSGDYWILSLSYYHDFSAQGLARTSKTAQTIAREIQAEYRAGFRALSMESDFNFGKQGLEYYLYSKMLWNPQLTATELGAIRDRWLQRSFGSGWHAMKAYYDFMAEENAGLNAPNNWAKAIRLIEAADTKIDAVKESDAQRRLDDLKQFWYFYYLTETGQNKPDSRAFREFAWKGQMSYMTAMHMVTQRFLNTRSAKEAAGAEFNTGPARYTSEETQAWWDKVLNNWRVTPVSSFADARLADGTLGRAVDQNDLVAVQEFGNELQDVPFFYNGGTSPGPVNFLTVASKAGEEIGFKVLWPYDTRPQYRDTDVFYGISRWNPQTKEWNELVDKTMTSIHSQSATAEGGRAYQLAEARFRVPEPGTYRVEVMNAGDLAKVTTLSYDVENEKYSSLDSHTYIGRQSGHTQSPVYFYIPKGTKSIDLEVWDTYNAKQLQLHTGLPATGLKKTRSVDVSARGTHIVKLEPGEDGSFATLAGAGFAFPHLYSLPSLWAKSPAALLVPRSVAQADALTITE